MTSLRPSLGNKANVLNHVSFRSVGIFVPKGVALRPDLLIELVVRHQMNVLDPVELRDRNLCSPRLQLIHSCLTDFLVDNGEVQTKALNVPFVILPKGTQ